MGGGNGFVIGALNKKKPTKRIPLQLPCVDSFSFCFSRPIASRDETAPVNEIEKNAGRRLRAALRRIDAVGG